MVGDMVLLQRGSGCRPSEVCNVRWCDIDPNDDIWVYEPFENKMEHKKKRRLIALREDSQTILEKYRHRPVEEFIFSPVETMRIISEQKRVARKTKVQPSQVKRSEKAHKKNSRLNNKYSTRAYERAIDRAAERAGVTAWSPNQIRHRFATNTDRNVSREAAMIALGHTQQSTTSNF
jgi:integrase